MACLRQAGLARMRSRLGAFSVCSAVIPLTSGVFIRMQFHHASRSTCVFRQVLGTAQTLHSCGPPMAGPPQFPPISFLWGAAGMPEPAPSLFPMWPSCTFTD